jgi:hypothetical protein
MIVKDEAEILARCFASCRDLIDHWVICDTGSTDGTQDVIRREMDDIPGELHERPWVNFGANRTELMALARGKADYLLLLDADMTVAQPDPLGPLTAGSYLLRHASPDYDYRVKRLVRGDLDWRYVGTTHEVIQSADDSETVEHLDAIVIEHHADGDSWSHKYERDLELLTRELQQEPESPRALFYLAQTCRDLGRETANKHMLGNAIEHYQLRANMGGWEEETYCAQHQVGVLRAELGQWPAAMEALMRAWELRPQRLEAVHALTSELRERNQHHSAHRFAAMAANLGPLPKPDDILFVAPWVYEWGMLFEYSITSYWVGEHRNAIAACKRLLAIKSLPENHRKQTVENLRYATRALVQAAAEGPRPTRTIKARGTPTRRASTP